VKQNAGEMKTSILCLAVLSVVILLHTSEQAQASELSKLLEDEIAELKDEIEKRGGKKRPACGFTWRCKRRRSRRGKRFWGKRSGISHQSASFSFGTDDFDDKFMEDTVNEK